MIAPIANTRRNKPVWGENFRFQNPDSVDASLLRFQHKPFRVVGPEDFMPGPWPFDFVLEIEGERFVATTKEVSGNV